MTVPEVVQSLLLEGVARGRSSRPTTRASGTAPTSARSPTAGSRCATARRLMETQVELAEVPGVTVLSTTSAARPSCAATAAGASSPSPGSASSSTSGCARAAATAATRATACPCSRSTRRTAARPASTRRAATSTCRACRATARRSPPSPSTTRPTPAPPDAPGTTGDPGAGAARPVAASCRPTPSRSASRASAAPASSRSARCSARRRCSTATSCAASTRPACRRRPARSSATSASAAVDVPASNHANSSGVDCLLAFDLLVAASDTHRVGADRDAHDRRRLGRLDADRGDGRPPDDAVPGRSTRSPGASTRCRAPTTTASSTPPALATGLFGDSTTANILLLGVAVQAGRRRRRPGARSSGRSSSTASPSPATSPRSAGAGAGRRSRPRSSRPPASPCAPAPETTDELIDRLAADLVGYQSERYAQRFLDLVGVARDAEQRVDPASTAFTEAVARHGHKLMAYKDEYEVARLLLAPEARAAYEAVGGPRHEGHVAPAPADAARRRDEAEDEARAAHEARAVVARPLEAPARHARRPVPLGRGAQARAGDGARVRAGRRAARRAGSTRRTSTRPSRSPSLPDQVRGYEHLKLARADRYRAELRRRGLGRRSDRLHRIRSAIEPSSGARAPTRAAPTMPASFCSAAGTISVPTSSSGTHLSAFRLAPAADDDQRRREQRDDGLEVALRPARPSPSTTAPRGRGPTPRPAARRRGRRPRGGRARCSARARRR